MHIVIANRWFPPEGGWGGVAMYNYQVARAYRQLGHAVTVVTARLSLQIPATQERDGLRYRHLFVRDAYPWRRLPFIGRYVRPLQQLAYSRRVDRALRLVQQEQSVDLVEFAEVNAEGYFFARSAPAAVVVRCHTPNFVLMRHYTRQEAPFDTRVIIHCEKDLIRRAHALTAPSADMARTIAAECGVTLADIAIIPNPLDVGEFAPVDRTPRRPASPLVLYVGRLERAKGVGVLAQAIPCILRAVPQARFAFVGADRPTGLGPSQRAALEAQLAAAGVRDSVEFAGPVNQAALLDWYRRADICVVPSLMYESFSYTCAQALAAGLPVVASRIGGIPETIADGLTGLLVTPGQIQELSEAIILLASDPARRQRLGQAGRAAAQRVFHPLRVAELNLAIYQQACDRFSKLAQPQDTADHRQLPA